ncbi:MAG: PolC-type DNA polymerase III [Eubacteriales bacterium]|nr:PolC-type DNA polymerase III [Eubacteriales bacterium]
MAKPFFEVFPTLKVQGDLRTAFEETQVERLATNSAHTRYKICLRSGHLIHKGRIFRMEEELAAQVFGSCPVGGSGRRGGVPGGAASVAGGAEVYIDEHYTLSAQYDSKSLMKEYFESLSEEFTHFSPVIGKLFREASIAYADGDAVTVTIEDSCVSRDKGESLETTLNRIFRERCGIAATITVEYEKRKRERRRMKREWIPVSDDGYGASHAAESAGAGAYAAAGGYADAVADGADRYAGDARPAYAGTVGQSGYPVPDAMAQGNRAGGHAGSDAATDDYYAAMAQSAGAEPMPWDDPAAGYDGAGYGAAGATGAVAGNAGRGAAGTAGAAAGNAGSDAAQAAGAYTGNAGRGTAGAVGAAAGNAGNEGRGASGSRGGYGSGGRGGSGAGRGRGRSGGYGGKGGFRGYKRSDDPDVIYGRDFDDDSISISDIVGEIGEVTIRGRIMATDRRDIKNEKTIVKFSITDFEDSIYGKLFIATEFVDELLSNLKAGAFVKVKGMSQMDSFDKEVVIGSIVGIMKIPPFIETRKDHYVNKRVELHCHTKMSDMDGVSECKDIVKRAYEWGMPAIAITDHGNVQAFPDANHVREDLLKAENKRRKEAGLEPVDPQKFFKVIYGVEAYIVDDLKQIAVYGSQETPDDRLDSRPYVVFDLETTGLSPVKNRIIEFGAVKIVNGEIVDRFSEFVNPKIPIPYEIERLTSISDSMVIGADPIEEVMPRFLAFSEGCVLVGHNVGFDISFVKENCRRLELPCDFTTVDTVGMARVLLPGHARYTLDAVAKLLGVSLENHHRAVDDAEATAGIFQKFLPKLSDRGAETFGQMNALEDSNPDVIRRLKTYHCILLAQNNTGRVNLYTMISQSHLTYFQKRPRIPKSLLMKRREGIIVGSACMAGELFQALLEGKPDEQIAGIVNFYDYLEIQPRGNNMFMVESDRYPEVQSEEDVLEFNRKIVALGEQFNKPVVATCDVHFLDPQDQIYRTIIQDGLGMGAEEPAPLFLHTTDEMMEEFAYLGAKKCEEVVITNTQKIADRIEAISPVRPDKCPPVIPNSDETLREICYAKAHKMYGDPLPEIVEERLERELNSIIKNGYSVMYIIAQKLVWKSVEDGYLVGSRGSVGSSFVATMSGITEVNPLSPHYYCENCHFTDFDSPEVMKYRGRCGIDMPARKCPNCGEWLKKDGFEIPFETFLGFKGDKEPDIDLNFSGEYQSKAHKYAEVIFGAGQTFKAGTIATVADKTAYGYVKNYFERKDEPKRRCEIERLLKGCTGIRRSTGQHPGGIVVLPLGEDINTFTPVQHPANDMTTDIITTHFDYHSIDHNLLKLDILGHDDPTMIRMLQDLTGMDPLTIPLDDPKVMSLFQSTEALGITPDQIGGVKTGALGVPEFGTKFVQGMLEDTRPSSFSELVRISGLSHGTDVWLGNAQTLIQEGKATLSTAICTRDDIMSYLIGKGVEKALSFKIMESVRKGKGLQPEMEEAMRENDVPDWYIDSCKKIAYMFPRAHAAAYVMMAWRIAYCKVYYPLAYYAAYFSIRASAFSYELMCQGQRHMEAIMADYMRRKDTLSKKEQDAYGDMQIVQEMYARGFDFIPIDITRAGSRSFKIIDGKIMPSLNSIDGLGEKAADAVVEAVKDGPFLSKDDFWNRTKVPKTVIDLMDSLHLLGDLPESNQISLFDLMK